MTNSPGARVARVLVNTWLRYTYSGWYVESMHPVGVLGTHTYTEVRRHTYYSQRDQGAVGVLYLVIVLRVATYTNTES